VLAGVDLREHELFSFYDGLFLNSEWSLMNALKHYPEHSKRFIVTGFPLDYSRLDPFRARQKDERIVAYNQRFALERAPALAVEIARVLIAEGYRVQQLSGEPISKIEGRNPDLARLIRVGQNVGLEFIYNKTKHEYHEKLAAASVVLTTSLCDNLPVSMLEAIYVGAVPLAPRSMCFPEFVHADNLYTPYSIDEIVSLVKQKPVRKHRFEQYSHEVVLERYVTALESVRSPTRL